jgi:SagB-type dehydrogenase family enzyme
MSIFLLFLLLKGGGEIMEVKLPKPILRGKMSVEECIAKRRSIRNYKGTPLTIDELSQLLWATQGITHREGLRAAPSAGATYPLEIRVAKEDGLFRYIPKGHKLIKEKDEDLRRRLAIASLGQPWVEEAPCSFIFSAVYERTTRRYGKRGERYVHIEVGHAAENLHLQAVALGLGSVPIGAFKDEEVKKIVGLPKNEEPLYIVPVGR